jgi:hypothetical protein
VKYRLMIVLGAVLAACVLWLLVGRFTASSPAVTGVGYYKAAEQLEERREWEHARDAWLMAKAYAARVSQSTAEANGRRAYCDYRIGMTYRAEGAYRQAAANIQLALTTPASDIDSFVGRNGAKEIRRDLSDINQLMSGQP